MTRLRYEMEGPSEYDKLVQNAGGEEITPHDRDPSLPTVRDELLLTAERGGAAFLAGAAEGYMDDLTVGPVDVRAAGALVSKGLGLYRASQGHQDARHMLAVGDGLLSSYLHSVGRDVGEHVKDKWAQPQGEQKSAAAQGTQAQQAQAQPQGAQPTPQIQGPLGPPVREVILTPEPELGCADRR